MDRIEILALQLFKKDFGQEATVEDHTELWPEYVMEASQVLHEKDMKRGD